MCVMAYMFANKTLLQRLKKLFKSKAFSHFILNKRVQSFESQKSQILVTVSHMSRHTCRSLCLHIKVKKKLAWWHGLQS